MGKRCGCDLLINLRAYMKCVRSSFRPHSKFFRCLLLGALFIFPGNTILRAQTEFEGPHGTANWPRFTDAPNSLYNYLADQTYAYLDQRTNKISSIQSLADWRQRQQWIRTTLVAAVGPFPEETPLNATVTKVVTKDGYRMENIVYESRPGFFVTSALFLPIGLKEGAKAPAIIYCSGHSDTGYRYF